MKYILTILLSLSAVLPLWAQSLEPVKLDCPLRIEPAPSGTFAEIRSNHFHGGLDLRIGGDEGVGLPVYAPADGYVSRLRISAYDGGKMLYINHKGNITTVYLHLDGYHGAIAEYVLNYQREHQCYSFDTTISEGVLPVRRGEIIAYAGNSGMSGGPHLHYEVRNTRTQQSLNPLDYGIAIHDTIPPALRGIRLLPVDKNTRINHGKSTHQVDLANNPETLGSEFNPIPVFGRFYVGVWASDRSKGSTNNNGYQRIDIWVDGRPFFQYCVDKITFGDTRAINAQLEYGRYCSTKEPYIITRRLPGDPSHVARTFGDGSIGFIQSDTTLHRVTIAVSDYNGNQTVRCVYLRNHFETIVPMHDVPEHPSYHLSSDPLLVRWPLSVSRGNYQIDLPAGMVYEDDLLTHGTQFDRRQISPVVTVRPWLSPFPPHRTWTLRMPIPIGYEPEQLVICRLNGDNASAQSTRIVERKIEGKPGRWLETDCRWWGNFVVKADTAAPWVKAVNFKNGARFTGKVLNLKMWDDLSGVREYRCFINGEWVLAEFDGKSATLSIKLSQVPAADKDLELKVFLTDACGNAREQTFAIKR